MPRRDPVRTKTVIDNKTIEQVNSFNYLVNMISYVKELDIDNKVHNYLKITGILNNVFRQQKSLKKTGIKLYNTIDWPSHCCYMVVKLGLLKQGTPEE
jgi:hypothetical protein